MNKHIRLAKIIINKDRKYAKGKFSVSMHKGTIYGRILPFGDLCKWDEKTCGWMKAEIGHKSDKEKQNAGRNI